MRNCFQYPHEGHSETSHDQALLDPFVHYIKMKAYMRVDGCVCGRGGGTWPRGWLFLPPDTHTLLTMFIGTRYGKLFTASSWWAFRNFKWPGSSQSLWSLHKSENIDEGWGGWGVTFYPRVDCLARPLLTMVIGTRYKKLFPASSWRAFRNFKWPGSSQSLLSLHKNETIDEGCGVGWWGQDTVGTR